MSLDELFNSARMLNEPPVSSGESTSMNKELLGQCNEGSAATGE
ncbi:MAG: hypothetical protein OFPII_19200 [Osedax symbiont Rs1]|nr:MAG: hypothetical protein OFPII_19200 [Osedax symbiont Rs1]